MSHAVFEQNFSTEIARLQPDLVYTMPSTPLTPAQVGQSPTMSNGLLAAPTSLFSPGHGRSGSTATITSPYTLTLQPASADASPTKQRGPRPHQLDRASSIYSSAPLEASPPSQGRIYHTNGVHFAPSLTNGQDGRESPAPSSVANTMTSEKSGSILSRFSSLRRKK